MRALIEGKGCSQLIACVDQDYVPIAPVPKNKHSVLTEHQRDMRKQKWSVLTSLMSGFTLCTVPDMIYDVFGGTLNLTQPH